MSSHPEQKSERKPTPAYVRVLRSYLRNVSSPAVWAPMAIIALLLALSADYWNSLRVLDGDLEPSLISENVSQLADSVSEASSIAASEIDSSDVLSDLLAQAELPVMADDNSVEAAQEQVQQINLDDVDFLGLPDLSQAANPNTTATGVSAETANATTPSRSLSLLEVLSDNYSAGSDRSTSQDVANNNTAASMNTAPMAITTMGAVPMGGSSAGMGTGNLATMGATTNSLAQTSQPSASGSMLVSPGSSPTAVLTQFSGSTGFTGYPYGGVTAPSVNSFSNTPTFTGYPRSSMSGNPAASYNQGYTGYATSPYVAPAAGVAPSAATYSPSSLDPYSNVQYGSQPTSIIAPTGVNTTPGMNGSPQTGYATGVPNGAVAAPAAVPYSVPRSAPGRYIGNGEINTFANP